MGKKNVESIPAPNAVEIKNTPEQSSTARKRWQALLGKVTADQATARALQTEDRTRHAAGLIDEIKQARRRPKVRDGILSLLKSHLDVSDAMFERQKYSAKEVISHKRAKSQSTTVGDDSVSYYTIAKYDRQARLLYSITPEIREKMDKIKEANELAAKKRMDQKPGIIGKLIQHSILGQVLQANPRFYQLNPLVHLPILCRRCRRPLEETLESRFTSIGILFCILFPIVGILLLFANREFTCVVCDELYVYGDLTARPVEYDSDNEDDVRKN
ncbi:hypothetical protein Ocin01_05425 [Orchesella cincta]|uniref:Brain protein I3 n=1 Tax=Orchesella cincta TaxID=48709 RepID=A0A1D2N7N2_ORCCI|nr:hypothetical protein Ocin01_05425 [Orchesella cincta]